MQIADDQTVEIALSVYFRERGKIGLAPTSLVAIACLTFINAHFKLNFNVDKRC